MIKKRINKRYSEAFKLQVVAEYEDGSSVQALRLKYNIGGNNTVGNWVEKYGHKAFRDKVVRIQKTEEYLELKKMKKHITKLESALSESVLENRMLKATIEVADKALNTDLKKNYAPT
jgi:transposase-like protein